MLVRFSVENFRSFRERQTLYLEAAEEYSDWLNENSTCSCNTRILNSAIIYGANASGKTNLLLALWRMRQFMLSSTTIDTVATGLILEPFVLSKRYVTQPETFEVEFTLEGKWFIYGFSLQGPGNKVSEYIVAKEWLLEKKGNEYSEYFLRETRKIASGAVESVISVNPEKMPDGKGLESRTRADALFITVSAQFAEPICQKILAYFQGSIAIISGVNHTDVRDFSTQKLREGSPLSTTIKQLIRAADTGIQDLRLTADGQLTSIHNIYDDNATPIGQVPFLFSLSESQGTQKLFDLAPVIITALNNGYILIVDEFESKLHPLLVRQLIELFNRQETNPKGAQLIANVQSPDLLAYQVPSPEQKGLIPRLRKDQLYVIEKDRREASKLSSLAEFQEQEDETNASPLSLDQEYLQGAFGGIPFVRPLFGEGEPND